ncbi:serine hydrolase domain-containing protein [Mumia quercus]|uniref:serine hydrolase domain-containing protein n=1 Tax=Mumia quercus TaxID=2976125 RepID=UPI0021D2141F|nr:serine hydrolase domain-containing protein [Mumia quercus]
MISEPTPPAVLPSTAVHLEAAVAAAQAASRAPSLSAAVVRDGEVVWRGVRGSTVRSGEKARPTAETQYRIGSITKSLTAALVLQLADEGALDLGDPVGAYVPEGPFADATVRGLLSHGAGLPAEPAGPWWERSPGSTYEELVAAHTGASPVLAPGERYHYSNLSYGILGRLVEVLRAAPWREVVAERLLVPLGMSRTTYAPTAPHADGFSVEALTGLLVAEPHQDTGAMAPAGQLWSTPSDLCRWLAELARPTVLSPQAVTAMATPQSADPDEKGAGAYGLGLRLTVAGERVLAGHGGSMPGFLAGAYVDRDSGVGAVVLANTAYGLDVGALPRTLIETVLAHEPEIAAEWTPVTELPDGVRELVGTWHWGHQPFVAAWDGSALAFTSDTGREFRFAQSGPDTWTGLSGYQLGETLRVVRRTDGTISHLDLGTFCYTRIPYDPSVPIPGGA